MSFPQQPNKKALTFDGGAEEAVANVGPAEVHPDDGDGDEDDAAGDDVEEALEKVAGVRLGRGAEGGDGEADEDGEGGPGGEEAGAVLHEVSGSPRERERRRQALVLVDRKLLVRHRAVRLCPGAAERRRSEPELAAAEEEESGLGGEEEERVRVWWRIFQGRV